MSGGSTNAIPQISVAEPAESSQTPSHLPAKAARYAHKIREFSILPDGRGSNHAFLASFLGKLRTSSYPQSNPSRKEEKFVIAYTFSRIQHNDVDSWTLSNAKEYKSCFDFAAEARPQDGNLPCRILFLRGFPSAEWLGLIGARYKIDAELFMRFLHFGSEKGTSLNHSLPALPAGTWNLLELPIVTIGQRQGFGQPVRQAEIDHMRTKAKERLQKYHDHLRGNTEKKVATSVVRDVFVLDQSCFALEQRIWISLARIPSQGQKVAPWTLVIWMDAGSTPSMKAVKALGILPDEFGNDDTSLSPVIDYKPNTALVLGKLSCPSTDRGAEAASQLCIGYGKTLSPEVMAADGFYALTEVFNITTASVNQYFNLLEQKLAGFTNDEHYDDFDMLSNLRYSKDILYRQQRHLEQVLAWLKFHKQHSADDWRTTSTEDVKATRSFDTVVHRYEYLLTHVKTLQLQCQESISNLMSRINLKEVKTSYELSRRIGRLTFLAAIFAPMAFTTSFYSMDVGLTGRNLSNWFAVTIGVMVLTLILMLFDVSGWLVVQYRRGRDAIIKLALS